MRYFFSACKRYSQLFLSILFFGLFSSGAIVFADYSQGATLNPAASCAPGSCTVTIPPASGVAIGNTITSATQGSLFFAGAAGVLAQDNSNLFWNDATNRLGIGIAVPTTALDVVGTVHSTAVTTGTITTTGNISVGASGYTTSYSGTGTDADIHITGTYTGPVDNTYTIVVSCGNIDCGAPNQFEVYKNGTFINGGYAMDSADTAAPLPFDGGLSVGFDDGGTYYGNHETADVLTITATASGEINATSSYKINTGFFGSQDQGTFNLYLGKDTPFSTNTGSYSTFVGVGAGIVNVAGTQNTFIGANAGSGNIGGSLNTAVGAIAGSSLTSGGQNTFLGQQAGNSITTGSNNVFIGYTSTGANAVANSTALGAQSNVSHNNSIAVGAFATTSAINQMVVGSSSSSINDIYFGNGVTANTAGNVTINASGGSGSNKAGGSITIAGGKGTGTTGAGGAIIFSTSDLGGGSATTLQSLTEKARISSTGNFSIGATPTFQVNASGDITKLHGVTTTFPSSNSSGILTNNGSGTLTWQSSSFTVGSFDGNTASTDGASVSGTTLYMQSASSTKPGLISTTSQEFSGLKDFLGGIKVSDGVGGLKFNVNTSGNITKLNGVTTSFPSSNSSGFLTNNGSGTLTWSSSTVTIGTLNGQTKSTDGAVFASGSLYMQTAEATRAGLVSTADQTFAGIKSTTIWDATTQFNYNGSFFASQDTTNRATFIGYHSSAPVFGAVDSVFLGHNTGVSGTDNVWIGSEAGKDALGSKSNSVFLGYASGKDQNGTSNVFVGHQSGNSAVGSSNIYIGLNIGLGVTGSSNLLIGGTNLSTISNATALGIGAISAGNAIAIGTASVAAANEFVAGSNTFSINNVYFGKGSTNAVPTGVVINATGGSGADIAGADLTLAGGKSTGAGAGGSIIFQTTSATGTSSTLNSLATRMTIDTDGKIYMNNLTVATGGPDALCITNSGTEILRNTGAATCTVSSQRFKHDIMDLDSGLDTVIALRPVSFRYNANNRLHLGLVAEEVNITEPRLVFYDEDGITPRGVNYEDLTAVLVKAVQELDIKLQNISSLNFSDGTSVADYLASQSDKFINGIVHIAKLIVGSPDARTGITLYDEVTGDPYCLSIANGVTKTAAGECGIITPEPVVPASTPLPETTDAPTEPTTSESENTPAEAETVTPPADTVTPPTETEPAPEPVPTP